MNPILPGILVKDRPDIHFSIQFCFVESRLQLFFYAKCAHDVMHIKVPYSQSCKMHPTDSVLCL